MKGVIYMIDREKLNHLLTQTQIILLERIRKLAEASELVDNIKLEVESAADEYLMCLIRHELMYRKTLNDLEMHFDEIERDLWNQVLHIDQKTKEEA